MSENSGEAFAKYHDEKAGHGGVAWEFHSRAATFLRSAESIFASLREQVRTLTARAENAETHLAEANATKTDMLRDIVNTRANRDEANRNRRRLEEENEALREQVAELEEEHEEDQGVIRVWRGRTERAESERDALRARVAEMKAENERLARHHAERVDERNAAQQRAKVLEADVEALKFALGVTKREAP